MFKKKRERERKCSDAPLIYKIKQSLTIYNIAPAYFGLALITKQRSYSFTT